MYKSTFTARLTRTAISLGIVVALYCAYTLTAVPLIEPPLAVRAGGQKASSEDIEKARNIHLPYLELFAAYFPPDHWVHQNPKVLVNDAAMLLIKDYNPLPDGQVELNPCVMIFFPQQRSDSFEPQRQALILEAPQGAILEFADGFDLSQAKIGRLSHGHLRGEVTIRSDMSDPGPEDDLLVRTREIQLTEDRIWTEHDVKFRVGENSGHGTQMEIRLLPNERHGGTAAMNVAGVQSMQLLRNVKMNLVMGNSGLLPEEGTKKATPPGVKEDPGPPVEITCRGPFIFDLVRHIATFEEHVDVIRFNPTGTSDQMTCELLAIHFLPDEEKAREMAKESGSAPKGMKPLRPKMLEARGEPVVVRSPSTGGQARCERLRYDLESRTIALDSTDEIMLFQGTNEIHAPALQYQPSETPGGLGMVWAAGPGWLRAAADDDPTKIFEARWQQELHLRRHEEEHVISVRGRPQLGMVGMGSLTADEVHLWLKEVPQTVADAADSSPANEEGETSADQPKPKIEPDRLLASGGVLIDSESLTANTRRMEAWFKQLAPTLQVAEAKPNKPATPQPDAGLQPVRGPNSNQSPSPQTANSNEPQSQTVADQRLKPKYNLRGELIRLQVAMTGEETHVTDATVSGQVNLRETQTARPDEKPLIIQGDKLQLSKAHVPESYVAVSGRPAVVLARGLTMQGGMIELDRGDNRLWINGPGSMTLPAKRDLRGEATENQQMLTINWRGKMDFNGLVVEFQEDVVGQGESQLLRTGKLQAELMEKVDFSTGGKDSNTEIRRITCQDGVYLENQTIVAGERASLDKMTTRDLTIDQTTGDLFGNGPGWLTSLRRGGAGGDNPLGGGPLAQPVSTPVAGGAGGGDPDELKYLRVDFRRAMEGNTIKKEITFVGEARAIYGPVANWDKTIDPDDPRGLGERDVMLNTDRLKVNEMDTMRNGRKTMEMEALGNTLVEGQTFTARAERMAYAQAKELLVLEGTAKTDAQLWRQSHVGAPASHAAARKILYWRDTNRVEINDARYFGSQFGGGKK